MDGHNVLLVSYHFPPMGGSGVQRALKLAKYLPSFGWCVRVLCAGHHHYPLIDESLAGELDSATEIDRVLGWEPGALAARFAKLASPLVRSDHRLKALEDRAYWRLAGAASILRLPETEWLWKRAALRRARELASRGVVKAVVTTSPPLTTHVVGHSLKAEFGIPWIADLRDPITDNFAYAPRSEREDAFCRRLERMAVNESDACVVTCPELAIRLRERFLLSSPNRIHVITNGFDPADAPMDSARSDAAGALASNRFEMLYVGAFYRQQTIGPILDAMRLLIARRAEAKPHLRFRVVGSLSATEKQLIRASDSAFLELAGYLPHEQAVAAMQNADAVVLMTPGNEGGRLCVPAKAYEYLAFGPHIIAITHSGTALERWLKAAGNSTCVNHPVQASALADAIGHCYDDWRQNSLQVRRSIDAIDVFCRKQIARQYAELLNACTNGAVEVGPCVKAIEEAAA